MAYLAQYKVGNKNKRKNNQCGVELFALACTKLQDNVTQYSETYSVGYAVT